VESQIEILKAYVVASERGKKPVSYRDVGNIVKIHPVDVSKCNKFFSDIGFLEKEGKKYLPSKFVIDFYNNSQFDPEKSKNLLREPIEKSWFGELTKKLLIYRKVVDQEELISKIGIKAEAIEKDKPALKQLIEYMEFVKFIRKISDSDGYELDKAIEVPLEEKKLNKEIKKAEKIPISKKEIEKHYEHPITFNITITPETTKEELEKMVELVKEFIEEKTGEE